MNLGDLIREEQLKENAINTKDTGGLQQMIGQTENMLNKYFKDFFQYKNSKEHIHSDKKSKRAGPKGLAIQLIKEHEHKLAHLLDEVKNKSQFVGHANTSYSIFNILYREIAEEQNYCKRIHEEVLSHFGQLETLHRILNQYKTEKIHPQKTPLQHVSKKSKKTKK